MGCGFRIIPRPRMETISLSLFDWSDVLFFFSLLDGVGVRKQQPRSKYHNFHESHPTGNYRKHKATVLW